MNYSNNNKFDSTNLSNSGKKQSHFSKTSLQNIENGNGKPYHSKNGEMKMENMDSPYQTKTSMTPNKTGNKFNSSMNLGFSSLNNSTMQQSISMNSTGIQGKNH
jgi:hypothetical protein